jgi:hypothetical protein
MIVTFLAMLEMIRLKLIRVFQQGGQGAIRVYKRARPTDAPHPIHDPEDEYKAHHPGAGSREPEAGSREQEAGSRQPEAGTREPEGGSAERAEEKEDDQQ